LGVVLLLFGVFSALVFLPLGASIALVGVAAIIYGILREETPKEMTLANLRVEEEKREAEFASTEGDIDSEEAYSKLLTRYVNRWGVQTGMELLENEIIAYTRRGVSFSDAVKKVYQRQKETS